MDRMTKLSRSTLQFGAYAAIALTLACSVSVVSEGEARPRALIDRLPAGAAAIAWVDFEALAEELPQSQWDAYEEMLRDDEYLRDLERFREATGIDVRHDFGQMGIALMPGASDGAIPLVLITANFDRDRIESALADAGSIEYEGTTMYFGEELARHIEEAIGSPDDTDRSRADREAEVASANDVYLVAILDDTTLAIGTEESLRVAIDVDGGRRETLKSDPDMNDLISDVAGRGQIWLVATKSTWDERFDDIDQSGAAAMLPTTVIESIETVTMSMRMGDGLALRLTGIAGSAEDAAMMTESLNGMISVGKMMLQGSEPELFEILDRGVRAAQDDRTISIEANLTEADLEYLRRMADEESSNQEIGSGS